MYGFDWTIKYTLKKYSKIIYKYTYIILKNHINIKNV